MKKIPDSLMAEFAESLQFTYDLDDVSDGAWFSMLENDAWHFIQSHNLKGVDENTAVHQLIAWNNIKGQKNE